MIMAKGESSRRYWTRLIRDHAQQGKDRSKGRKKKGRKHK